MERKSTSKKPRTSIDARKASISLGSSFVYVISCKKKRKYGLGFSTRIHTASSCLKEQLRGRVVAEAERLWGRCSLPLVPPDCERSETHGQALLPPQNP